MEKTVKIYSYTKVWKVEKKIYSIGNVVLPTPLNPYDFVGYAMVIVVVAILGKIFSSINQIPFIIRYIGIPYIAVGYLGKKKLDGKSPIRFLAGYVLYLLTVRGSFLQRFQKYPEREKKIVLDWNCSAR